MSTPENNENKSRLVLSLFSFDSLSNGCPNINQSTNVFTPYDVGNLYVAAYGNPNPSNITGYWLPVQFCTSEIGSSVDPVCSESSSILNTVTSECYIRLDIQIIYANIGSVTNPQPILGAVVFHYQRTVSDKFLNYIYSSFQTFT